jgi:hypothetical protein
MSSNEPIIIDRAERAQRSRALGAHCRCSTGARRSACTFFVFSEPREFPLFFVCYDHFGSPVGKG